MNDRKYTPVLPVIAAVSFAIDRSHCDYFSDRGTDYNYNFLELPTFLHTASRISKNLHLLCLRPRCLCSARKQLSAHVSAARRLWQKFAVACYGQTD